MIFNMFFPPFKKQETSIRSVSSNVNGKTC